MKPTRLVLRSLTHYWRTNVAVVLGVATAVAVLAGALLVGDSVRGSLRDLVLQRLGRADRAVLSSGFFREAFAASLEPELPTPRPIPNVAPLVIMQGLVTDQASGRRASRVAVYGVDDRFWRFHQVASIRGPEGRNAFLSRALAADIGASAGSDIVVRVERPSAIPLESLHGRRDNVGRSLRLKVQSVVAPEEQGDFSLQPSQGAVRAVFVPMKRLQQDLEVSDRVNALLVSENGDELPGAIRGGPGLRQAHGIPSVSRDERTALHDLVRRRFALEDVGLSVRVIEASRAVAVESAAGLLDGPRVKAVDAAAAEHSVQTQSILTYLANTIRSGERQVPYSLVTALDLNTVVREGGPERAALRRLGGEPDGRRTALRQGGGEADGRTAAVQQAGGEDGRGAGLSGPPNDRGSGLRHAQAIPSLSRDERAALPPTAPIVLNDWTARELAVKVGDPITIEYYAWEDPGRLLTRSADFHVAAVIPIAGAAADRDLAPDYPGISEAKTFNDWNPPFPIDLKRIRKVDEDYWDKYRTTPKGFIPLEVGQRLWASRFGDRTSVRITPGPDQSISDVRDRFASDLREAIDPMALGLAVRDVRADGLAASRGATDFGEYFTYFSFFLVVSALMLAALFFRLSVEQRAREVGLLRAVGFSTSRVRRLFVAEGFVLAVIGSILGMAGAVSYGAVMMAGLRTWWSGAVGTTALRLHVSPVSLAGGAIGALIAAMVCIWWTLRSLSRISERSLLAGDVNVGRPFSPPLKLRRTAEALADAGQGRQVARATGARNLLAALKRPPYVGGTFAILGAALLVASAFGAIDRAGAFFGAGTSLLVAALCAVTMWLRRPPHSSLGGRGWRPVWRIGWRNAADRPGRSVLAIGVIASAAFILIAVDAFRREGPPPTDRHSGVGGYPLLVDLLLPIVNDPNSLDGREAIGLPAGDQIAIEPFRVLPGDDASCLNLYEPRNPRVLGASRRFIESGRFAFHSAAATTAAERANPWLLLTRDLGADIVPIIADANSMTYVLHKSIGDDIVITPGDRPVRLRLVAALADSIFQGELMMSEANFARLFPEQEGYRFLLIDAPADRVARTAAEIEEGAGDLGADAVETTVRLAEFHTVENTYLSTFQTLGGLGLLVGTIGLAAVVLRNVLERRRELALLGAVGYRRRHMFTIVVAENLLLLTWGLLIGVVCALVAIGPAMAERGGRLPVTSSSALLVVAVLASGLVSSVVATRAALRTPLLSSLRSE